MLYKQVEVSCVFERKHILLFSFEIQNRQESSLYGFCAIYRHGEIFGEEHL